MPKLSLSPVRGRQMYLGNIPAPEDPLPAPPPRLLARFVAERPLVVRVRSVRELRLWLAVARPHDRAIYYQGDEPLIDGRQRDALAAALADEALKQSDAKDVPLRSKCRHIRGRYTGQGRVRLHTEQLPLGLGVRCYCVKAEPKPQPRAGARRAA